MAKTSSKRGRRASKPARPARKKTVGRKAAGKTKARAAASRRTATKRVARPAARAPQANPLQRLAERIVTVTIGNDDEGTLALYADDVESTEMGQPPLRGIDAIKQKFQMWRSMTSDASFAPRTVTASGDTVVIEWVGTVTLAASGKTVQLHEVAIHEIENGKIVRERFYYDPAQLQP